MRDYHPRFAELEEMKLRKREKADCTVKCLAILANIEYGLAHAYLKKAGRPHGKGPSWEQFWDVWESVGYMVTKVWHRATSAEGLTPKTVGKKFPKGRYILAMRGHVAALVDGQVIDWSEDTKKRIVEIRRVDPIESEDERPAILFG